VSRLPPGERPSARALASQSSGVDPWACPRCQCKGPHDVQNVYEAGGVRKRRRVCRNCKQLIRTGELPVPDGYKLKIVPDDESEVA
jgi:transcriptional regulator NrdR family protein